MKRHHYFPLVAIAFIFFLVVTLFYLSEGNFKPINPSATSEALTNTSVNYSCEKGKNVLELLQSHSNDLGLQDTSFGKMVTKINGQEQGNNKYWMYKVDQKEATIGAETYVCQSSEEITWELR